MKRTLRFKASARLQSILSRELVADTNVALLEFVKNAYDAEASAVLVKFDLEDRSSDSVIWIADDGEGMDLDAFAKNWMRPGFSKKSGYEPPPGRRVPVGEKGLGRLAAGRLGGVLDVYTRRSVRQPWLHAHFKWSDFNDMNVDLDAIKIPVDDEHVPDVRVSKTGTVVRISSLHSNWNRRTPGRKVAGRAETRIGRLRQDFEVLLLPLATVGSEFDITLEHNSSLPEDISGPVVAPGLDELDYAFHFQFRRIKGKWLSQVKIRRSKEIAAEVGAPRTSNEKVEPPAVALDIDFADVGPFEGSFLYAPRSASRLRELRVPLGVRVYRDDVRVDPYGENRDDWLGARAKKASRQGYAAIQPNALYGAVKITKQSNPMLVPMANREGLIENEAHDAFIAVSQGLFEAFEKIVYKELVEPNWTRLPAKLQKQAESEQAFAFMLARTAVHAVRQPVAGAGAELDRLQHVIESGDVAKNIRPELQELHDRTLAHLQRIEDIVARMLEVFDFEPEASQFNLKRTVEEVIERTAASAESQKVDVRIAGGGEEIQVDLSRDLVEHALVELTENAIHATCQGEPKGRVEIAVEEKDGCAIISVGDNGPGVPQEIERHLFVRAQSTRGHIGFGLILTRQMLRLMRGDLELASTGRDGTIFRIVLPIRSDGVGQARSDAPG
jgi:signal transduction histidine kinase